MRNQWVSKLGIFCLVLIFSFGITACGYRASQDQVGGINLDGLYSGWKDSNEAISVSILSAKDVPLIPARLAEKASMNGNIPLNIYIRGKFKIRIYILFQTGKIKEGKLTTTQTKNIIRRVDKLIKKFINSGPPKNSYPRNPVEFIVFG